MLTICEYFIILLITAHGCISKYFWFVHVKMVYKFCTITTGIILYQTCLCSFCFKDLLRKFAIYYQLALHWAMCPFVYSFNCKCWTRIVLQNAQGREIGDILHLNSKERSVPSVHGICLLSHHLQPHVYFESITSFNKAKNISSLQKKMSKYSLLILIFTNCTQIFSLYNINKV